MNMETTKNEEPQWPYEMFGIECGDGWKGLYQPIIDWIDNYNEDKEGDDRIEIHQIKEKFGGLRFYASHYTDELRKMIDEAEEKSYVTCEQCGKPCKQTVKKHWIYTLCQECYDSIEERQKKQMEDFWKKIKDKYNKQDNGEHQ